MEKKNQLRSCCKNSLSSREVVARDLPHPTMLLLLNRKQQPYFMREAEDPGTLRAAKLSGMTPNLQGVGPVFARLASTAMTNGADRFSRSVIPQGFYAGYSERNVKAFTLIELLVVVLIIGILAAVAVPQYKIAVAKSRFAALKSLTKSIADAQEIYFAANGIYTNNFEELSMDMPGGKKAGSQINRYLYDWGECWLYIQDAGFERVWCSNSSVNLAYIIYLQHTSSSRAGRRGCSVRKTTDMTSYQNTVCKQETQGAVPSSAVDVDGNEITYMYP